MNSNDTYFSGNYQHAWKYIIPPGLSEAETDFIIQEGQLVAGHRVLDLMCGYGRHSLSLARRGVAVEAIDNLSSYIEEIKAAAAAENLPVTARCTDVLTAPLDGQFDAAICMGNSFAFFNRDDATTIFRNVAAHLKPGGMLLLNSWMIAEIAIRHFKERDWSMAGDYKCLLENRFLFQPSRIETEQTLIAPDGSIENLNGVDYIFTLDEVSAMFSEAGLSFQNIYSTPRRRRFSLGDPSAYITATKS